MSDTPALLVLEDGRCFGGRAFGAVGTTIGEIVFSTGMTGYQETLTDPSYHRQIVVMTAPHVGNTGWNSEDMESRKVWVAGLVIRDLAVRPSNWRSETTLEQALADEGVVSMTGVDTRAITRHVRERGAMRAGIFSGEAAQRPRAELIAQVQDAPKMAGSQLASEVSTDEAYVVPAVGEKRFTVAAIDLGIKGMTPQLMAQRGCEVHVLPARATFEQIQSVSPDGVFFSNGPGDPATADAEVEVLRQVLDARIPFFGICFGNQLLGRALGFGTFKLKYGHRGINQPVLDKATGTVEITAQNHGFAVDAPLEGSVAAPYDGQRSDGGAAYGQVEVSHIGLNDQVVEGLRCTQIPAFSVQYHPEAAAGPHDSQYLFDRFLDLMSQGSHAHAETATAGEEA